MPKQIIFEGAAVEPETREFFIKMAKLAYDNELNVSLTEQPSNAAQEAYLTPTHQFQEGALNICIWREVETAFEAVKNPPST